MSRPSWAQVSIPNLIHNYRLISGYLRNSELMALVKANAYGHGAVECARALEQEAGTKWFGVALIEEGMELRRAGIEGRILCLGGIWDGQGEMTIEHGLTTVINRIDQAGELNARAGILGKKAVCHLKVDTGLGRLGIPLSDLPAFANQLRNCRHLEIEGVLTHLAEADADDHSFTELQISRYWEAIEILRQAGIEPSLKHLANSAAIHGFPASHGDLARSGAAMYGYTRDVIGRSRPPYPVKQVMSLHSRIFQIKTVPAGTPLGYARTFVTSRASKIATLPIGYADGIPRQLSNKGEFLVKGRRVPIVGRISMDLTIIDVTELEVVDVGDEVVLIGEQEGERVTVEEWAERAGTISYEVACGIAARVPRVYSREK